MAEIPSPTLEQKTPFPSQRELFLACLRPGNHVDLVLDRDDSEETTEARGSMLHDLTRERKLILAQTSPPLSRSRIGTDLEVIFLCRRNDVPGGRILLVGYSTKLLDIVPDYKLSASASETVLVVDAPKRLDETSLRMHIRVVPPLEYEMKAYIGAALFRKVIDLEAKKTYHLLRGELWNRDKHPKLMVRDLSAKIKKTVENVNRQAGDVRQVMVGDISERGVRLVHSLGWEYKPESKLDITLSWREESLNLEAIVLRSGNEEFRGSASMGSTSLRFSNLPLETSRRLAKLINEILRRDLVKRSEQ